MKFKYEKLNHKELNYYNNVYKKFLLGNSIVFTNPNRGRIKKDILTQLHKSII